MTGISKSFAETLWRQTDLWRKMVLWGPYGDKLFCGDLVKTDCFFSPTFLLKSAKKKRLFLVSEGEIIVRFRCSIALITYISVKSLQG